jgi:hypothetical protein
LNDIPTIITSLQKDPDDVEALLAATEILKRSIDPDDYDAAIRRDGGDLGNLPPRAKSPGEFSGLADAIMRALRKAGVQQHSDFNLRNLRDLWNSHKGPPSVAIRKAFYRPIGNAINDLKDDLATGANKSPNPAAAIGESTPPTPLCSHSADFHSVNWYGTPYTFTGTQSRCVEVLWRAWSGKSPTVGQALILSEANSNASRLHDVFKKKGKMHPAWRTMIVPDGKGNFRLADPPQK